LRRRHELERRRRDLADIHAILGAMKNLALTEMRKLGRFVSHQELLVNRLDAARADFFAFHRLPAALERRNVFVLLGSERGFCGDFNRAILDALEERLALQRHSEAAFVVVGYKLAVKAAGDSRVAATIDGASVAEELGTVLGELVEILARVAGEPGRLALTVIHHAADGRRVEVSDIDPFGPPRDRAPIAAAYPPDIHLSPEDVRAGLAEQYLYAALEGFLCGSLMAENLQRLRHMEGAMHRVEDDALALGRLCDRLRQEEITEEIEVILLTTVSAGTEGVPTD
jgi:F-type H+-transporting ATPase subunit gamma